MSKSGVACCTEASPPLAFPEQERTQQEQHTGTHKKRQKLTRIVYILSG